MEENRYKYLFPFEKIPAGADVLIYGAGILGHEYLKQISITNYCHIIGMVDRNYKKYSASGVPVYAPDRIHALSFDYVVIALRGATGILDVRNNLKKEGVPDDKIVFVYERELLEGKVSLSAASEIPVSELAFSKKQPSILLYLTGGIGDYIFIKRFLVEIISLMPDCLIDLYCSKQAEILRILYSDLGNINLICDNLGTRYQAHKDKYVLSMVISGSGYLQVDYLARKHFPASDAKFAEMMQKVREKAEEENFNVATPRSAIFLRRIFHGQNCYSAYNYDVFNISDKKVHIPLDGSVRKEFENLRLKNYITMSCDAGASKDNSVVAKSWPTGHFSRLARLLKKKYPNFSLVQIGASDAEHIEGVDAYMLGKSFSLAEHILANAAFHIDTEGGLVHLASQLGTKCFVLFGPTWEKYYGYDGNVNIRAGNCHECCGVYPDANQCARNLKEPECMYSITPEMVLQKVEEYLRAGHRGRSCNEDRGI